MFGSLGAPEFLIVGPLGAPELLIIGAVIILIFGVGKISGLGRELGSSIKEFRRAVKDEDGEKADKAKAAQPQTQYSQAPTAAPPPPAQPTGEGKPPQVF